MDTKEAIEYFENYIKAVTLMGSPESKQDKVFKKTITLLKRGEKYEQMWGEFKKYHWKKPNSVEITLDICNRIERLEQKYFPVKDKDYFYEATSKDPRLKKIPFKKGGGQ